MALTMRLLMPLGSYPLVCIPIASIFSASALRFSMDNITTNNEDELDFDYVFTDEE